MLPSALAALACVARCPSKSAYADCVVTEGDRIAQLILEKICPADIEVVESLAKTERGSGGFGSTGVSLTKVAVADTKIPII